MMRAMRRLMWSGLCVCGAGALLWAGGPPAEPQRFRLEAEEVIVNKEVLRKDRMTPVTWNLWTTDKDAEKKWSGCGVVVQSPRVMADRATPAEGAPPLRIVIPLPDEGPWDIRVVGPHRPIGYSADGETYRRLQGASYLARGYRSASREFACWFDDLYAAEQPEKRGSTYLDYFEVTRSAGQASGAD
ncbi:MAG: hypothetical protein ACI4WT_02730 [Oligosphaeraceae bacterium]